ncbi:hypothetical protein ACHAXR_005169 [Thalassiosira sp. AJA248-18]
MLKRYAINLKRRVVDEILPLQPVSMNQMEDFILKTSQLLDSVILRNDIPITDLPPSILTELLNQKTEALDKEWLDRTECQLDSILENLSGIEGLPTKEQVLSATKAKVFEWDPLTMKQYEGHQSDASYAEQKMSLIVGINAVNKYCKQFCNSNYTKGVLTNGAPGAGKTFILQAQGLYAMTRGLRVMSTSLMAIRAIAIGGYHLHRLFQWEVGKNANLFRLAEMATRKLDRLSNIIFLHLILTMDVLLLDECGQLETIRLYHRRKSVSEALETFVDDMKSKLQRDGVRFTVCTSRDTKKTSGSLGSLQETHDAQVVKLLNQKVREPRTLLLYPTCLFVSTINKGKAYSQSETLMMLDVPSQVDVNNRAPIMLWRPPYANSELERNLDHRNPPSRETLLANNWKEVKVEYCRERLVTRAHVSACRGQYTITHVAASTVNKQMGNTLHGPCAIEITEEYYPWERGQRRDCGLPLQGDKPPEAMSVIDMADTFPWRVCDQFVPCSNSGFVYLLVSTPAPERVYVGTTKNLAVRLTQHNRGFGSEGTGANPEFLPWAVLSYMTNMASLSRSERMGLERAWQLLNTKSVQEGQQGIEQYIENGRRVVNDHNEQNQEQMDRRINYVILAQRRYAPELATDNQATQTKSPLDTMNAGNNEGGLDEDNEDSMDFEYCV